MKKLWLPLGFIVLLGLLAVGLKLNPREVPSPLIGKPAPAFELPRLDAAGRRPSRRRRCSARCGCSTCGPRGARRAWSSIRWSPSSRRRVPVVGLNYKDAREDALPWLARNGNPYQLSVYDAAGRIGIDYGVYGVPETYVIDRKGVIRYKHIGPLTPEVAQKKLVPLVKELSGG